MKQIILALLILTSVIFISSCGSDSAGGGGIGPGGGGTGSVTFTTTLVQDQQQNYYFRFTPSTGVTVETITATCTQLQINNQVVTNPNTTTVYTANDPIDVGPIQNLAAGQQWTFVVAGKLGSSTGTAYTANTSFTVQ